MATLETALAAWRRGDYEGALAAAGAALDQNPDLIPLLSLMAQLHTEMKNPASAVGFLRRVTSLAPTDAAAARRLADAQSACGAWREAIDTYRRALQLEPGSVRALNNLGQAVEKTGELAQAEQCYRSALACDADYAIAHHNLGRVLSATGRRSEALEHHERATTLRPDLFEAWFSNARLLLDVGRAPQALSGIDAALALRPAAPDAWLLRGEILNHLGRYEDALRACDQALAPRKDHPETLYCRAQMRHMLGDRQAAVEGFREALRANPEYQAARVAAAIAEIPVLPWTEAEAAASRAACSAGLAALESAPIENPMPEPPGWIGAMQPFYVAYQDDDVRALLAMHGRYCAQGMEGWLRTAGLSAVTNRAARRSRPRVTFVSAQVLTHSVVTAISRGWMLGLDRELFEMDVFHTGATADAQTRTIQDIADHFEMGARSTKDWAVAIAARQPDVLIYPEIGMNQTTLQLAAMRLAGCQLATWGHPVTTGLPTMDYFLSADAFEPPDAADHYTERLIKLPHFGVSYEPPLPAASAAPVPQRDETRRTTILVCAGTPYKYSPQYDGVLVDIAKRLGRCQFHFFTFRDGALSRRLMSRLNAAFSSAGLDGANHLIMRPWASPAEFRQFLRTADIYLDTIGFSGFNTVMQALECGLPVVAYRGRYMRGRFGSGILERLSLQHWIADDPQSYVELCVSLARRPEARAQIRAHLQMQLSSVYRDPAPIIALQNFLLKSVDGRVEVQ